MRRARWAAILATLVAVVLTACSGVPTTGPVEVETQRTHAVDPPVEIRPVPPPADASAFQIVQGFLHAMAESRGDYSVAKQYLTPDAATAWRPDHGVRIYADTGQQGVPHVAGDSVVLDTQLQAALDSRGGYSRANGELHHDFGMQRVAGQWRISAPPDGLLLGVDLFQRAFAPVTLYFYEPGLSTLVPDIVHMPREKRTASVVVQSLLAGPSPSLRTAVATTLPEGTRLLGGPVSVDPSGVATVRLSNEIASLDDPMRTRMAAQIALTLGRSLAEGTVTALRIQQDQAAFPIPDAAGGIIRLSQLARYDPLSLQTSGELFGVSDGRIVHLKDTDRGGDPDRVSGPLGLTQRPIDSLGVSVTASEIAVVTDGRRRLQLGQLVEGRDPVVVVESDGLLPPQFTRFDELWSVGTVAGRSVLYRVVAGQARQVEAPALDGISVEQFRISPDGMRIAVAGTRAGQPVFGVVVLNRGQGGPVAATWRPLDLVVDGTGPARVSAVGWRSDTTMVLMGSERDSTIVNPYEVDVDGSRIRRANVTLSPVALATLPYQRYQAVMLGRDGNAYRRSDDYHWPQYTFGVALTAVAYPG